MNTEKVDFPPLLPIKAFTPTTISKFETTLEYSGNLEKEAGKIVDESKRLSEIRSTTGIEQATQQRDLDISYLVFIAFRLMSEGDNNLQKLWADAFTNKSIELYGQPNTEQADKLLATQINSLHKLPAPQILQDQYADALREAGIDIQATTEAASSFEFEGAQVELANYLRATYAEVFDALNTSSYTQPLSPSEIAEAFDRGLSALKKKDSSWDEWSIDRNEDKDSLSVEASKKQIIVGMKRVNLSPKELDGLFAHEILRHANTSINGTKNGIKALPGYLDFEEGMGVLHEYALSGTMKDDVIDRYSDIALALKTTADGSRTPRSKLLAIASSRERLRNSQLPLDEQLSDNEMDKKVYGQINRIYRGTPGSDSVVGVFTKDIAYLGGFLRAGEYIQKQLDEGKTIEQIMDYISQGKFDPTNQSHATYIDEHSKPKPSKELVRMVNLR